MRFTNESRPLVAFVLVAVAAAIVVVFLLGDRLRGPASGDQMAAVEPDKVGQTDEAEKADTAASADDLGETAGTATVSSEPTADEKQDRQQDHVTAGEEPTAPKVPTFDIVRVEDDGAAVIAGQATPGAEIMLTLGGKAIGTAIANERGEWVVTPEKALPPGDHDLVIVSRAADGSMTTSDQVVSVAVPEADGEQPLIVLSENDQPSKVLQKPESSDETQVAASDPADNAGQSQIETQEQKTVVSTDPPSTAALVMEAVDYNDQGDILFSGTAGPGETVRVYVNNIYIGDAIADESGRWVYRGRSEIKPGVHTLRIDQVRTDGKVAQRRELPFERAEPSKVVELHDAQKQSDQEASGQADASASGSAATTASTSPTSNGTQVGADDTTASTSSSELEPLKLTGKVVIQPGNNLWNISRVIYGRGVRYSVIYEANKDQIRNPHRIYPGQIFTTPGIVPPTEIDPKRRDPLEYAEEPDQ